MKKGKPLAPGDTIGIIAPASPERDLHKIQQGRVKLEALGFRVVLGDSCFDAYGGYLAGRPERRAQDVDRMFQDPDIDAILCLRGGYGTLHLLNILDYDGMAANPKLFIGYSDITALHAAIGQRAGLVTVHGPMLTSDIANDRFSEFSFTCLWRCITEWNPLGTLPNPPGDAIKCMVEGKVRGKIVGGNLSLIVATMGTPYELDTKDKLLFLEDVGEEPYHIDRMLTQLDLAGKLADAAGFIIGNWADCTSTDYPDGLTVIEVLKRTIVPYAKPTIYNVQAGHCNPALTLPLGVEATLDATHHRLTIEESVTAHG